MCACVLKQGSHQQMGCRLFFGRDLQTELIELHEPIFLEQLAKSGALLWHHAVGPLITGAVLECWAKKDVIPACACVRVYVRVFFPRKQSPPNVKADAARQLHSGAEGSDSIMDDASNVRVWMDKIYMTDKRP